jgi:hypothetical protein
MGIKSKSGKTLSALLFCAGAAQAVHADPETRIQALQLLQENRISYDEFRALYGNGDIHKTVSTQITAANYSDQITAANYADQITAANYADQITAANYANQITAANYGSVVLNADDSVPQPETK